MALVLKDRVLETCAAPGTGTITLLGAVTGYQAFSTVGNGNTCYYAIADQNGANWEVGIGTYSSGTLARTTVLSSSNAGSLTNFSTGSQNVFLTYPSERSVNLSSAALTSGRVAYATTDGLLTDSANLTFNGTTLTANTIGAYTLSGTIAGGGNQINNVIIGTTTPLAGSFTTINASTSITNAGLTSGRVTYAGASGLLTDSANLLYSGTDLTVYGVRVGRGAGGVATNTAIGYQSFASNTTGNYCTAGGYKALSANNGDNNTAFGFQAGQSITSGGQNVFIGGQCGITTTTGSNNAALGSNCFISNSTGSSNSALGYYALSSNTSGGQNVAVGGNALYTNTTASNNTAVGYQALYSNTTASNNTAVGYQAGLNNTTGSAINAFGYLALDANTTGSNNIAMGNNALGANSTGSFNTAMGDSALGANTTANDNAAFGQGALDANTTGASNTAIGRDALGANTTADNNTAVGFQAGYSNTTASNNTAVGYQAGYSNTTGGGSTAVGYQAGFSNTTTDDLNAFGFQALEKNTTGTNSAFGTRSGRFTTTGSRNSAFGYVSFYTNTTGSYNTALGDNALYSNTTASNNTAVGYQAGYSNITGVQSNYVGRQAGYTSNANYCTMMGDQAGYATTGAKNTFIGYYAGGLITSGANNTILGGYNGNQGGLDIRTASNYIVLSDGDGNPLIATYPGASVSLNGAVPQTGTGITFPATQLASANANTLDDYEEGTWTPTIAGDGTEFVGASYTARAGKYVKVGDVVWVSFDIDVSLAGTLINNASVGGLPFAIPNSANLSNGGGGINYVNGIQQNYVYQSCYPQNNASFLFITGRTAASTGSITLASSAFYANSMRLAGFAWYRTTV